MKKTRVFLSLVSLLLCVSMFVGTTFAWFTDSVSSVSNIIQSGNLDVELEYLNADGNWTPVRADTNVFPEDVLWEPGHTEAVYLRVSNLGSLALKYQLGINVASEIASVNVYGERFALSDFIWVGVIDGVSTPYADRAAARAAVTSGTSIKEGLVKENTLLAGAEPQYVAMVVYMPETVGNEANHKTGATPPQISLGLQVLATQQMNEFDTFGNDYDAPAEYPVGKLNFKAAEPILSKTDEGLLGAAMTIGETDSGVSAEIPAGVKLASDAQTLELTVSSLDSSEANLTVRDNETARPMEVHMEGVAEDNTVPMLVVLEGAVRAGLNTSSVELYHVEDGVTVQMVQVALEEVDEHNEFYYDAATGNITMAVATFSEFVVIEDDNNPWLGNIDISWYNTTATVFELSTADQLAGLGAIVDGTAGIPADTFDGKEIRLKNDIDLGNANGNPTSFNPIGFKYETDADGRVFKGTFNGNNKTIRNLYQDGWDLGLSYSTAGGGLFASAVDATFQNIKLSGATVVMECIDMGTLVGYAYGNCEFKNIRVSDSVVANYNRYTGGVVGEVNGNHLFSDVIVDADVTISALWGTFDPSCGGIIGGKYGNATVKMQNCVSACSLDVYNDATSAYEWYAYRRCGSLIGNTEETTTNANGTTIAAAPFLTCENCTVFYGDWADYTYCQFENENNPGKEYPWVRVQAGLYNDAYSNPRYGHPLDVNGKSVVDAAHTHQDGDECTVSLPFAQLYGGGQGVYGADSHPGVTIGKNVITYMDGETLLGYEYVTAGDYTISRTHSKSGETFEGWVTISGSKVTSIPADYTENITLYAHFKNVYVVRFVDHQGNVVGTAEFNPTSGNLTSGSIPSDYKVGDFTYSWSYYKDYTTGTKQDIILGPSQTYGGALNLYPHYDEYGVLIYYSVKAQDDASAFDSTVVIPGVVNGVPVTQVEDLSGGWFTSKVTTIIIEEGVTTLDERSLAGTRNLKAVSIPSSVTYIGSFALANNVAGLAYKNVTITFNGTKAQWDAIRKESDWQNGLETGSRIYCTDGYYTVKRSGWGLLGEKYTWTWTSY